VARPCMNEHGTARRFAEIVGKKRAFRSLAVRAAGAA